MKHTNYTILEESTAFELETTIAEWMKDGYVCLGGVSVKSNVEEVYIVYTECKRLVTEHTYCQAVVIEEK